MARPCSVFPAAIGGSAIAAPVTNNDRRQMAKICRNSVGEDTSMTAPLVGLLERSRGCRLAAPLTSDGERNRPLPCFAVGRVCLPPQRVGGWHQPTERAVERVR